VNKPILIKVSTYILELFNCIAVGLRDQIKRDIEGAGMLITSEKFDFRHEGFILHIQPRFMDENTEESFIRKMKLSPYWANCASMFKIERGNVSKKNLLASK
jgi:hypothetical protein